MSTQPSLVSVQNLAFRLGISLRRGTKVTRPPDPEGLWGYVTQGLDVGKGRRLEWAHFMYGMGLDQLTAWIFNLEGKIEEAEDSYDRCIRGLCDEEVERIKSLASEAVVIENKDGIHASTQIDEVFIREAGKKETAQMHRAIVLKAQAMRAERQLAIQLASSDHRDFTDLRRRLTCRPPIHEVEAEFPYWWKELRRELAQ